MEEMFTTNYYTQGIWVILAGIVVAYIALNILWNKKLVPSRRQKGVATPYFGNMFRRITQFAFKEDPRSIAPKKAGPKVQKLLTLKTINWLLLLATFVMIGLGSIDAWIPAVMLIVLVAVQTTGPLKQRDIILNRMFAVANSGFKYGKGAELNPWGYVRIKSWETLTMPGETHISIPANWNASSLASRDGFEAHFNTTVTDNNSWIYEWKTADGIVITRPINHLPQRAEYPGSEKYPWHVIPIGLGAQGEVTVDLATTPHMLICGTTGSGKSLALDTPVLTTKGWKNIGTLEVGDEIYTTNGSTTKVNHLHPIITPQKAYKITFKSGETLTVDGEHLWQTLTKKQAVEQYKGTTPLQGKPLVSEEVLPTVLDEYFNATANDSIDIPALKKMLRLESSSALYRVAKQVGVSELVSKTVFVNYKTNPVTQIQKFTTVDKNEFIQLYNNRNTTPTQKHPLTAFMLEKLTEYANEVRENDTVTLDDILTYTNSKPYDVSTKWFKENLDFSKPSTVMLTEATQKAQQVASPFPTKIFSLETEEDYVTYENLLMLCPRASQKETKQFFYYLARKAQTKKIIKKESNRFFNGDVKQISTSPIEHYPKKLILRAILERSGYYPEQTKLNSNETVQSTEELIDSFISNSYLYKGDTLTSSNHYMTPTVPLEGNSNIILPVAPYTLGAYLGDGYSSSGAICGEDLEVFENIQEEGYEIQNVYQREGNTKPFYEITFSGLLKELQTIGVAHPNRETNKFHGEVKTIPTEYLQTTVENRRQLLRGLLDTDGSVKKDGRIVFSNTNKNIINGVITLVASLGYVSMMETGKANTKSPKHYKDCYHVVFSANPEDKLFGINRKNKTHSERYKQDIINHLLQLHKITAIEETTPVPMRCISVDAENRLFLVGETLIPTHNSVLQRNLIFHCIQHNDMFRFLGVDVKRVELKPFAKYSETVLGIGTNLEDGVEIVRYAKEVMETRYQEMEERGINHFKDMLDENGKPPYAIMLMVDEAYMFMATEGAKTDEGKMRDQLHGDAAVMLGEIARLGRAAGVHLVLATQRPDATVIRGELKANLDIRIAAGRLDATPSSMVLDSAAATQLPGDIKGRGIVRFGGHQEQFQGYFAEQDWIDKWLAEHPGVEPSIYPASSGEETKPRSDDETLEQLAADLDFNDGSIEIDGEVVSDLISEEETTVMIEELETPLEVLENTNVNPDLPEVAAPPVPVSEKPPVINIPETAPVKDALKEAEEKEKEEYLKRFGLVQDDTALDWFTEELLKIQNGETETEDKTPKTVPTNKEEEPVKVSTETVKTGLKPAPGLPTLNVPPGGLPQLPLNPKEAVNSAVKPEGKLPPLPSLPSLPPLPEIPGKDKTN